jgi:hypothetical protein
MISEDREQSLYFQKIARHFLSRRGAPFFLSAKDLDLISSWEEAGLPLPVVLEGIEKAFDSYRLRQRKADKVLSLSFCNTQVSKAFQQHRERRVGGSQKIVSRQEKRGRLQAEIERFLAHLPAEVEFLKEIYQEARQKIAGTDAIDEAMEDLDGRVERLLLASAAEEDRDRVKKEIRADGRRLAKDELTRVMSIQLVRHLRNKYKIPYLSPFYY